MGDAFSAPFILSCYKIIVPHTQLAIKWFTQMTKTLKTLIVLFYLLPSVPEAACGKSPVPASITRAGGIVRVGKLKLTFHCFLLCVCVCVRSISGRVEQYRRLFIF